MKQKPSDKQSRGMYSLHSIQSGVQRAQRCLDARLLKQALAHALAVPQLCRWGRGMEGAAGHVCAKRELSPLLESLGRCKQAVEPGRLTGYLSGSPAAAPAGAGRSAGRLWATGQTCSSGVAVATRCGTWWHCAPMQRAKAQ